MDIKRLELLADIAETHNLTISANNMGYTQSGVSHVIKKLEQELDISLLKRTNRGVVLLQLELILLLLFAGFLLSLKIFRENILTSHLRLEKADSKKSRNGCMPDLLILDLSVRLPNKILNL